MTTRAFDVPHGEATTALNKLLSELGDEGARVLAQLRTDPAFCRRLANFAIAGGYQPTTEQRRAREIMGQSFFGPEEVARHFDHTLTKAEREALGTVPFSVDILRECAKTHVLVADVGLSIIEVRQTCPELFYSSEGGWYADEKFATTRKEPRWRLIRKTPVPNSTSKTWQKQNTLLAQNEEIPSALAMVYTIIGHYLATGERLLENLYVRTSSVDADGDHVSVGIFGARGLYVDCHWDDRRDSALGVASARLPAEDR